MHAYSSSGCSDSSIARSGKDSLGRGRHVGEHNCGPPSVAQSETAEGTLSVDRDDVAAGVLGAKCTKLEKNVRSPCEDAQRRKSNVIGGLAISRGCWRVDIPGEVRLLRDSLLREWHFQSAAHYIRDLNARGIREAYGWTYAPARILDSEGDWR